MTKTGTLTITIKNRDDNGIIVTCQNLVNLNYNQKCTYNGVVLSGEYKFITGKYNDNANNELAKVLYTDIIINNFISCQLGDYNKNNNCEKCPDNVLHVH